MTLIRNNAIIENAIVGVMTMGEGEPDYEHGEDLWRISRGEPAGGIVRVYNTTFRNNYICAIINPYAERKTDLFDQSTFVTDDDIFLPYYEYGPCVVLNDVNTVHFQGCTFTTDQDYSPNQRLRTGILSYNSMFFVDAVCLNPTEGCTQIRKNEFINLVYGIKDLAFSPTRTFRVDQATFDGNVTGLYASGVSDARITRNEFLHINAADTLNQEIFGGLYLDYCHLYQVEDNYFHSDFTGIPTTLRSIGLVINNSNVGTEYLDEPDIIYNNTFERLSIGTLAQNKNRNHDGVKGLTIKCNDYFSNKYDIAVTIWNPQLTNDLGIKKTQGDNQYDIKAPAGNRFTIVHMHPGYPANYYNEGGQIDYLHHVVETNDPPNILPDYISNSVTPMLPSTTPSYPFTYNKTLCCPSTFYSSGGIGEERNKMFIAGNKVDSVATLLSLLTDGGNTEQLNSDILSSTSIQSIEIYNNLITKSPYLSDTVMVSSVKQENVLTSGMITEILSSNPQAAKSDNVLDEVQNRINSLDEDQMGQIMEGLYYLGAKETLEVNLSGYETDRCKALNQLIQYYSSDTIVLNPTDSIIFFLEESGYLWSKYHKSFIFGEKGNFQDQEALLNEIPDQYHFNQNTQEQHDIFTDYITLCKDYYLSGKSMIQPDSSQIQELYAINASSSGMAGVYARNALMAVNNYPYKEPYLLPKDEPKETKVRWESHKPCEQNVLRLFPNPAKNYVVAEIQTKENMSSTFLKLYDNTGNLIRSYPLSRSHDFLFIPLDRFPSGLYICILMHENEKLVSKKLIIEK